MKLSNNAKEIIKSRYAVSGETWEDISTRVGKAVGFHDINYISTFQEMIYNLYFIPGGRILRNAGKQRGSLFNCYNLPIGDSVEEIGQYIKDSLILWSEGGGVGCDFSTLRPKGDAILGKGGKTSGLVSFIEATDAVSKTIESGGSRRAAALGHVHVSHPEVLDFIDAKIDGNKLSYFNISVAVNGNFLAAVERDDTWTFSFNGKAYNTVPARSIWTKIIRNMHKCAEPGLINWDNFTKNNSYYYAPVVGTNPCFHGDTLIETVHGKIPIKDIKDDTYVYTMSNDGSLNIKKATASWMSGRNRLVCKIKYKGGYLTVTPDHKVYTLNRGWVQAQNLKHGDRLKSILRIRRGAKYSSVKLSEELKDYRMEHRFVYEGVYGELQPEFDVHHINGDTYDNRIENLESIHHNTHSTLTRYSSANNHQVRCKKTGRFISSENSKYGKKTIIPLPKYLKSNICGSRTVIAVKVHDIKCDVYDISVEDTHNVIANGIVAHNCGETCLSAYEACCLGSIVLPSFLTQTGRTDWAKLEKVIHAGIRFLDNIIDINKYALKQIEINVMNGRRIGLGVMGLAEYLFAKKVRYGSLKSIDKIEQLFKFIRNTCYQASIKLASEKRTFSKFDAVAYGKAFFIRTLPVSLRKDIKTYGIRNVTLMAMAPTGTISLIPECQSGIEPLFAKAVMRRDHISERLYIHPEYKRVLNKEIPNYLVDTNDLTATDHLEVQAAVQKYTDCSVSKTINLPKETKVDGLSELLLEYIHDLKGVTVYRDGSIENQVLTKISKQDIIKYTNKIETHMRAEDVQCIKGVCEI